MNMEQFFESKGIDIATLSTSTVTQINNQKTEWKRLNKLAMNTTLMTISDHILFEYDDCTTSDVLYAKICKRSKHGLANSIYHL
jgi:hypothetical protein